MIEFDKNMYGETPEEFKQLVKTAVKMDMQSHVHGKKDAGTAGGVTIGKHRKALIVFAIVMLLALATTAIAIGLRRSAEVNAISTARQTMIDEYHHTPETLGCFTADAERQQDMWIVTFTGSAWEMERLGDYTVLLKDGQPAEARWSHDDLDSSLWQDGSMNAPAWGAKQIMQRLEMDAEVWKERESVNWEKLSFEEAAKHMSSFRGYDDNKNVILFDRAIPNADDVPVEDVVEIARDAIANQYGIQEDALEGFELNISFGQSQDGSMIRQYIVQYKLPQDVLLPTVNYEAYTAYVSALSGKVIVLEWAVSNERRTLPEGSLGSYEKAVTEFINTGALEVKSASEKADIVTRINAAGFGYLLDAGLPYVAESGDDLSEADAVAHAQNELTDQYQIDPAAFPLFQVSTSLLELPEGRRWEITFTPHIQNAMDEPFWQGEILSRIGTYTVGMDAASGDTSDVAWSLEDRWINDIYTADTWATAPVYHGSTLKWIKVLRDETMVILAKYPANVQTYDLSMEDAATYDTLFREAGFSVGFPRGLPRESDISYDEALGIARDAILNEMPSAQELLKDAYVLGIYTVANPDMPSWAFTIAFVDDGMEATFSVWVDAETGEVTSLEGMSGGNG